MIYLVLIGYNNLRELIYLWVLFNKSGIKCNISYLKQNPNVLENLTFEGLKVFIKPSNNDTVNVIDIKNNIFVLEKPINLENIDNIYNDILSLT